LVNLNSLRYFKAANFGGLFFDPNFLNRLNRGKSI